MVRRGAKPLASALSLACLLATGIADTARADLQLCNRTSYVLDLALGLQSKGAAATRGWFRVDPGQCRSVLQGAIEAEHIYVHARSHAVYRDSPLPLAKHAELCIADGNFVVAGAQRCAAHAQQRLAAFTEIKPSQTDDGFTAHIAEEADYPLEQARLAGIQRLLVLGGYDAEPIDGIEGRKTEAALARFLRDRGLAASAAAGTEIFSALIEAAKQTEAAGLAWCNDTGYAVMASLGVEETNGIVTRGWYRVAARRCLKPEVAGTPARLYTFAEAVDDEGRAVRRADKPLSWGGPVVLCTRELKFEIADHRNCAERGLLATGFAAVELGERKGATIRFKE